MKDLLLWGISFLLLGHCLYYLRHNNFNKGDLSVWLLTGAMLVYTICRKQMDPWLSGTVPGRILLGFLAAAAFILLVSLIIILRGQVTHTADRSEKALIVLGCAVRGTKPCRVLVCRLEAVLSYYQKNPEVQIIVCGGQGPQEKISEALAMKNWLTAHEIPPEKIFLEDRSSSTEENFRFAKECLQKTGGNPVAPTAFITNGFHCYRAGKYAEKEGFSCARAVPAGLPAGQILTSYLREAIAVIHYLLFKDQPGIYARFFKRPLDVICSSAALIIMSPVFLIIAISVRIRLGSPVIFCQERPGKNCKIFRMYKFRSMTDARDKSGRLLPDRMRLNGFGKKLRSSSLDELPELWNILKGDMSLVGPRPLLVSYLPWYTEREQLRHTVRPGLTGLAQINGRNSADWDNRLELDVKYTENIRLTTDCKIIVRTIGAVLRQKNVAANTETAEGNLAQIRSTHIHPVQK